MKEYVRDMDYCEQENTTMTNEKFNHVTTEHCGISIGESLIDGEYNNPSLLHKTAGGSNMTEGESTIYFYAFRYCLGRMTYAVTDFCRQATKKIVEIKTRDLELMVKEITEAEQWDKENPDFHGRLGMDCDRAEWLKFRENIRHELEKRK